jgi:hypothetical protein
MPRVRLAGVPSYALSGAPRRELLDLNPVRAPPGSTMVTPNVERRDVLHGGFGEALEAEFSAYGVADARVDRIARAAGCNKNLIYVYFENKETLFTTVLHKHLLRVYQAVQFSPDDLPGYAVRG